RAATTPAVTCDSGERFIGAQGYAVRRCGRRKRTARRSLGERPAVNERPRLACQRDKALLVEARSHRARENGAEQSLSERELACPLEIPLPRPSIRRETSENCALNLR